MATLYHTMDNRDGTGEMFLYSQFIASPVGKPYYALVDFLRGVKIPRNNFKLAAKQSTEVEFFVTLPASAQVDHIYKGRVIIFRVPSFF